MSSKPISGRSPTDGMATSEAAVAVLTAGWPSRRRLASTERHGGGWARWLVRGSRSCTLIAARTPAMGAKSFHWRGPMRERPIPPGLSRRDRHNGRSRVRLRALQTVRLPAGQGGRPDLPTMAPGRRARRPCSRLWQMNVQRPHSLRSAGTQCGIPKSPNR
jgi:hypothetical protein